MTDFVSFIAVMATLVVGLSLLSVVFAVVLSIAVRAFQEN